VDFPYIPRGSLVAIELATTHDPQGGIIIPEQVKWRIEVGTVLAVGPGAQTEDGRRVPIDVVPGDRVVIREYQSFLLNYHGRNIRLLVDEFIDVKLVAGQGVVPLYDRIMLQDWRPYTESDEIIQPDGTRTYRYLAEVSAVGPGRWVSPEARNKPDVQVGETVVFQRWTSQPLRFEDYEFLAIRPQDVLGVL